MDDESTNPQEAELFVLRSMYGDDLDESYTASVWKAKAKKQPTDLREFLIKVHPHGPEKVSCGLYVKLPKGYPKVPPMLDIKNSVGLTPVLVKSILTDLRAQANKMLGGFMIAELVASCEEKINARNEKVVTNINQSLAAEMKERAVEDEQKRKREEKEAVERKQRADADRKAALAVQIDEEDRKTRERVEKQRLAERQQVAQVAGLRELVGEVGGRKELFERGVVINGIRVDVFHISDPKPDRLGVRWAAEPAAIEPAKLPLLECFIVTFKSSFYNTTAGLRKLRDLEEDIKRLLHVSHLGLIQLFGVKLSERQAGPTRHWSLSLIRERTDGVSLDQVLHYCPALGIDTSINYLCQLVSALSCLHSHRIIHQDLRADMVLLTKSSTDSESTVVKVQGALYYRRLLDLHKSNPIHDALDTARRPPAWPPPESIDKPLNYTFARDLWNIGVIWTEMLWGLAVIKQYPNLDAVFLAGTAKGLPADLAELLRLLLHPNPSQRPKCQALLEKMEKRKLVPPSPLIPLKMEIVTPIIEQSRTATSPDKSYFLSSLGPNWRTANVRPTHSRFTDDFEHLEHLGRGGFGSVDKVRMRLDHMIYAIKRIKLRSSDSESRILREVNALSQLNHRHIVRYITCWLEDLPLEKADQDAHSDSSQSSDKPMRQRRMSVLPDDEDLLRVDDSDFDSDHDLTKTQSFPSVVFAKDADDEEDGDSVSDGSSDSETSIENSRKLSRSAAVVPKSPKPSVQRILYIQMEFVEQQTLKEAIAAGLDEERYWKLFRQVLDAMAHMFSMGIVHRDIKLTNILIDKHGDAKLGDFGLAQATSTGAVIDQSSGVRRIEASASQTSSGVGTYLYVAPEISNPRSGPRDLAKADMFSLGVVFFEMVQGAFNTEQERYAVIQALREYLAFPNTWSSKPNQRKIVEWLLNHDPAKRPMPNELLSSGLLPERLENRRLEDALRLLVDKSGPHHQSLLTKLFSQPQDQIRPFVYDRAEQPSYTFLQTVVEDYVKGIFRRHGAINMEPPLLLPVGPNDLDERTAAIYLDRQGNLVALPSNGFLPFARLVVRRNVTRIKRYALGQSFEQGLAGGQPRIVSHAMFDIVTMEFNLAAEAEAIAVVDSIIRGMPALNEESWEVHISHGALLGALFEHVPQDQHTMIQTVLKDCGSPGFHFDRTELLDAGLSRTLVDDLEIIVRFEGDLENASRQLPRRISRILEMPSRRSRESPLNELREVLRFSSLLGVQSKLVFSPALSTYRHYFRDGVVFEFAARGKRKTILATGGRYDTLVRKVAPPTERGPPLVVGVQIATERIMQGLLRYQTSTVKQLTTNKNDEERSFGLWAPRRADVYVCSFQAGKLSERIEIVNSLWSNGISADVMYESAVEDTLENIMATCLKEGILYLVLTRSQTSGQVLRVKSVLRKTEAQVPRAELVNYLSHQLAEQQRIDLSTATAKAVVSSSSAAKLPVERREGKKTAMDLQMVVPEDEKQHQKFEKNQSKSDKGGQSKKRRAKEIYRDKAEKLYGEIQRAEQAGVPVVAIAVPSTIFARLIADTSWVTDDDAWRAILPVFDSATYANQIRDAISAKRVDGHRFIWLLSVREEPKRVFMLHFPA
ncbi:kinase-like protein [Dacryopinax primogenitus]|uniref:non-specific serine/threonine protein kinase n=1 Tax=Dacryopinax primogenitus (strain DJM 731) TaxID=1858805 RepID=M5FXJ7_DACPD|nr:kinase-like protein [Dacryopinax primogenitus]EJU02741.1 kinase-like protein [Dacryopinax primogenitus]